MAFSYALTSVWDCGVTPKKTWLSQCKLSHPSPNVEQAVSRTNHCLMRLGLQHLYQGEPCLYFTKVKKEKGNQGFPLGFCKSSRKAVAIATESVLVSDRQVGEFPPSAHWLKAGTYNNQKHLHNAQQTTYAAEAWQTNSSQWQQWTLAGLTTKSLDSVTVE